MGTESAPWPRERSPGPLWWIWPRANVQRDAISHKCSCQRDSALIPSGWGINKGAKKHQQSTALGLGLENIRGARARDGSGADARDRLPRVGKGRIGLRSLSTSAGETEVTIHKPIKPHLKTIPEIGQELSQLASGAAVPAHARAAR